MTEIQHLKNQLEVLNAAHSEKALKVIKLTKQLELSEEINSINKQIIEAQNKLIEQLKMQVSFISNAARGIFEAL